MKGRLCLSQRDKKIAGVCGGLAEYFNLDSSLVRLAWILLFILFRGLPVLIYILCWAVMPGGSEG